METLLIQPPLLGASRAVDELRDFIVSVSLREEPVLITGPPGVGKSLAAGKIHAIGPCSASPCWVADAGVWSAEAIDMALSGRDRVGPGTIYVREATDLDARSARTLVRAIEGGTRTRLVLGGCGDPFDPEWDELRAAGLLDATPYWHAIPALRERREDVPILSRYQVWLNSLPDEFEARWDRVRSELMPTLLDHSWPENVRELNVVLGEHCGGIEAGLPRRWVGEEGRESAQQEYIRRELEAAFEEVRGRLLLEAPRDPEWYLPHEPRDLEMFDEDPE